MQIQPRASTSATTGAAEPDPLRAACAADGDESRFRTLGEAFPLGVFRTDAHGLCTGVNSRWEAITGMRASEAIGTGWCRIVHPEDRETVLSERRRAIAEGDEVDLSFRVARDDGSLVHVRARSRPVHDDAGTPCGYLGSLEDVTEEVLRLEALSRSESLLDRTGAMAGVGGWELDLTTGALLWSEQTRRIHGLPQGHRPRLDEALDFYAPESRGPIEAAVDRAIAEGADWDLELRMIRADGVPIWVRAIGRAEHDARGRATRLLGAFQDVTERVERDRELERAHARISEDVERLKRLGQALDAQREFLEVTLQSIADAVITTDGDGRITWANPVAERLTGHDSAGSVGRPLAEVLRLVDEGSGRRLPDPVSAGPGTDGDGSGSGGGGGGGGVDGDDGETDRTALVSRTGETLGIELSIAPIRAKDGRSLGAVLVFRDVSERRRLSLEMNHRAAHDALTGLANRSEFEARLERALGRVREGAPGGALMYIDLDRFKIVNDACGHAVGDRLLVEVAALIGNAVRASDTLARIGGDEFAAILEGCSLERAVALGDEICERVEGFRFVHEGRRFPIGTSIGVAPIDERWATAAALVQAADACCYDAKEAGRDRTAVWTGPDPEARADAPRTRWAPRIEAALESGAFELHAQRVEALSPRTRSEAPGCHVEALLRLRDGAAGPIPPGAFLPAAERFELSARIDRWVLDRVIEALADAAHGAGVRTVSVNLSGRSIGDRAFHDDAIGRLADADESIRRRLCLEIPEAVAVGASEEAAAFAARARALGVRIAIDDAGAGAGAFGYLRGLPADVLKIDGRLVAAMVDEPLEAAAVRAIVDVAGVIGARTVAKRVDRAETLARARELGVDAAQGHHVHRPEPLAVALGAEARAPDPSGEVVRARVA